MAAPDRLPVHEPGVFNIEKFVAGRWHGGSNRLNREDAIATAKAWAEEDGAQHRVFDPDGNLVFDTHPGVEQFGFTDLPWELVAVPYHDSGWAIVDPTGYRIAIIQNASGLPANAANAGLLLAARDLFHLARRYASECADCHGSGKCPRAPFLDCTACADIRAVLAAAQTPAAPYLPGR